MQFRKLEVENYKCFNTLTQASFGPGFNFVIGQNNAGKSALLSGLTDFVNVPHRSVLSMPNEGDLPRDQSKFCHTAVFSYEDLFTDGVPFGGSMQIPFPMEEVPGFIENVRRSDGLLCRISLPELRVETIAPAPRPLHLLSEMALYTPIVREQGGHSVGIHGSAAGTNFDNTLQSRILQRARSAYRFAAERLNVGHYGNQSIKRDLDPTAANLPEVVNKLQELPLLRQRYIDIVRYVLPQIKDITAESGHGTQLVVWREDHTGEMRRDLAVDLQESGTGIGQVLAMIYVASQYINPKVIVIDEINAFLHPDAARRLLEALSQFSQHQYIIATHNPSLLTVVEPSAVLHVTSDGKESKVHNIDREDVRSTQAVLRDVGVRLSDVFAAERILWVEGPTEEAVFKDLIGTMPLADRRVQVLGIVNTGDLETDDRELAAQVYERLSKGGGLLPPAVAFIMDPEGRPEKSLEAIRKRTGGKAYFLKRRLIENYLLAPASIAEVLNTSLIDVENVDVDAVLDWIVAHGGEKKYLAEGMVPMSPEWLKDVHGATLLIDLFNALSESTVEYRKTRDSVAIARSIRGTAPELLSELVDVIREAVE